MATPRTIRIGGDLEVLRIGFGAMRITGPQILGWPADRENALRVLRRAVELGVNLIDTADSYGPEVSEILIAEALYPYPETLVIATKGGLLRTDSGAWPRDGRPEHLREACEGSLRRLRLDRIDLYQLHAPDPDVPFEESVGELVRLRDEGKIRHVGLSNVSVEQLRRAQELVPVVSVQNRYSLADRSSEDVLDECERHGIAFLPWYPLAAGDLAQPGGTVGRAASARGATPAQVALAWLLARSPVTVLIPGTSSPRHLEENVAALDLELTAEELAGLG
jgi:aryl-alcohol dehydrogenase-like predicted oxidoreductase